MQRLCLVRQAATAVRHDERDRPGHDPSRGGGSGHPRRLGGRSHWRRAQPRLRIGLVVCTAALKKAGVPAYGVHQVRWGGTREFVSWTSLDKMADLDGEGWLAKSMSEDARIKWVEKAQSMVGSSYFPAQNA